MTGFEKYISTIFHCAELHKHMGSGRFLMKVLHEQNPALHKVVANRHRLDPRFDVSNQAEFIDFVITNWKEFENA